MAKFEPYDFSFQFNQNGFEIYVANDLIKTPGGLPFKTLNSRMVGSFMDQLGSYPKWEVSNGIIISPRPIGVYTLFSLQLDLFEKKNLENDQLTYKEVLLDPVLHPQAGPEQIDQLFAWKKLDKWLSTVGAYIGYAPAFDQKTRQAISELVSATWSNMSPPERSVTQTLTCLYGSNLCAMALVLGKISPDIFAHAILATTPLHATFSFPVEDLSAEDVHSQEYSSIKISAYECMEYLEVSSMSNASLAALISGGESTKVEFKLTALGIPNSKPKEQRKAKYKIARTVVAMLSSSGGHVIIGVNNAGKVVGAPELQNQSGDDVQLAIMDYLCSQIGIDNMTSVGIYMKNIENNSVIVLSCKSRRESIPLKDGQGNIIYLYRQGPRSIQTNTPI